MATTATPNTPEPPPRRNDSVAVWDLVIDDMAERNRIGTHKYGTPLQAFNGRRAVVDAYGEVLDLAVYLRQEIEERRRLADRIDEFITGLPKMTNSLMERWTLSQALLAAVRDKLRGGC